MTNWTRWFDLDWNSDELRPDEQAFLTALQQATARWDVGYAATWASRCEEEHPCLIVAASLSDSVKNVMLAEFGVHYGDGRAQGDQLHICLHELPEEPTPFALDVSGGPEELAAECAAWFEKILSKPGVHQQWRREPHGRRYADAWKFADNGAEPAQSYDSAAAPRRQRRRLLRKGFVFGRGWIQVRGIEDPPSGERRVRRVRHRCRTRRTRRQWVRRGSTAGSPGRCRSTGSRGSRWPSRRLRRRGTVLIGRCGSCRPSRGSTSGCSARCTSG